MIVVASLAASLVRFRGDLISSLLARGHEVLACAPDHDEATEKVLTDWGVGFRRIPFSRVGLNPFEDLRYMAALYRLMKSEQPDLVFSYTPKPVIYAGIAARAAGVPHCALISGLGYGFGVETLKQRLLTRVVVRLYRTSLKSVKVAIFQNPDDLALFCSRKLVSPSQAKLVAGSGVDLKSFSPAPLPSEPVFLLMARMIPEKGVREYVEAARVVREAFPAARFLLAGWIEPRGSAIPAAEIEAWRREGVIDFLGGLEDVRPALARAAVYVLPSYYREGVPRSILEAMAMGRPIITTDMPGCRETVVDGKNGFLVSPRSADALARAMLSLVENRDRVAAMGAASRRMAEDRFGVESVNADMLSAMGLA